MSKNDRPAIVLASAGRPELLGRLVRELERQTSPFTLVLSVPDDASLPADGVPAGAVVARARGLAAQRNAGIAAVPDAELIFCFDDDAVVREDYLERAVRIFRARPEVVALTGRVLLDGATTDEIDHATAVEALGRSVEQSATGCVSSSRELYGCNFAFRRSVWLEQKFDERLPLYSWLEDHDFARRAARSGRLLTVADCVIVHLGANSGGRTAHRRLGYSQVMNPFYLTTTGSFSYALMARETVFRVGKNLVGALYGPDRAWRRRRLSGNLLAAADIIRGRVRPERILHIPVDASGN